ncbi:MAG: hypothetical protein QMB09_03655 [Flavobacteriales bacterium]|mgnify:FL=1|tara:strand:- start:119 stop:484 length:366 start_codon:yes stop_codon:yes gene_type:complete
MSKRIYKDGKYTGKEILTEKEHSEKQLLSNWSGRRTILFWIKLVGVMCIIGYMVDENGNFTPIISDYFGPPKDPEQFFTPELTITLVLIVVFLLLAKLLKRLSTYLLLVLLGLTLAWILFS